MAAFTRWQGGRQHCAANVRRRFSALQRITQGCCFNCLCRDCCCRGCCASWCLAHPVTGFIMGIPCIFSPCCSFPTSSPHSFPFLLSSLFPHWSPLHCHVSTCLLHCQPLPHPPLPISQSSSSISLWYRC